MQNNDPAQEDDVDALNEASLNTILDAQKRFEAIVQSGDGDRLRAAFHGLDGYLLGLNNAHGNLETILLEEALRTHPPMDLQLLWIFFKELGVGRFIVDPCYNVCAFSIVIRIDANIAFGSAYGPEYVARHSARVAEVVRYLAETLGMPVPGRRCFYIRPIGDAGPLLDLALRAGAWASYAALVPHIKGARETLILSDFVRHNKSKSHYNVYWLTRLLPNATDEQLDALLRAHPKDAHFVAEGEHRTRTRQHMRALLFLPKKGAPGKEVLENAHLLQWILERAHAEHRF